MKRIFILFIILVLVGTAAWYLFGTALTNNAGSSATSTDQQQDANGDSVQREAMQVIATDLAVPWDIAFLPGERMLVTERGGRLVEMDLDGEDQAHISVDGVVQSGEGGLLGIVLHPEFEQNQQIYLYMAQDTDRGVFENKVVRYRYNSGELSEEEVVIEGIEGAQYHDGGRMEFGPDGLLYVTTGDAGLRDPAQDINSLSGKTLRVHPDGSIPSNNPFENEVYSYGHRNSQGLAWDESGRLWSTEHGRSGVQSGMDEINLIESGSNYGWP
ncbi:MAG: PQQ-dependent sugar dehydrogenase, partial [Candidatus Paceibacterota bacterium]